MLLPNGSLANVYYALDRYCAEQLPTLTIRPHNTRRFIPPVDDPWVETHYDFLGLSGEFRRYITKSAQDNVYGIERQGYLQINIYQRARTFATRVTLAAARDTVVAAFPESQAIGVYNYTGGNTVDVIGQIIIQGIQEHSQDNGMRSGVPCHVVQVLTRYLEYYTRPQDSIPEPGP